MVSYYQTHKPTGVHPDTRTDAEKAESMASAEAALDARMATRRAATQDNMHNSMAEIQRITTNGPVLEVDGDALARSIRPTLCQQHGRTMPCTHPSHA